MKLLYILVAAVAVVFAAQAEPFKVIAPIGGNHNGQLARLVDIDTGTTIDSVLVADQAATFTGDIDESALAIVQVHTFATPIFVLEPGTISFHKDNTAFGTMLNDQARETAAELKDLSDAYDAASEAKKGALLEKFYKAVDDAMAENIDNALGLYYFMSSRYVDADAKTLRALYAKHPELKRYKRAQALLEAAEKAAIGRK